jgi:nucleoside 2-deoxyribosyltransferase
MLGKKIYWAAPLFNVEECEYNARNVKALEALGYKVFLPQRDAGEATESNLENIYYMDIQGLSYADIVVAVLNGRALDEGTVFEIGYATALEKPVFGICSDRRYPPHLRNAMFIKVHWVTTIEELIRALD